MRPTAADVRRTFLNHYDYARKQQAETFNRDLMKELSTTRSYAGRTVFELLQNALDRAVRRVVIALTPGPEQLLIVANDGPGVEVDPGYDYDPRDPKSTRKRSDFHALCSINTSNKSAAESIGNKGVGFRSVFSLGKRVQVWSRLAEPEGGYWGLEMLPEWTRGEADQRRKEDPAIEAGWQWLGDEPLPERSDLRARPSFYFPLPLRANAPPVTLPDAGALETVVLVPLSEESAVKQARETLEELTKTHLYFVGLREGKGAVVVTVHLETAAPRHLPLRHSEADENVGGVASWRVPEADAGRHDLAKRALGAGHELPKPGVAVAWPKESPDGAKDTWSPRVYGYIPTRIESPLGVDIHADFRLEENRTSINFDRKDPVGGYNAALFEAAAELHLVTVLRAFGLNDAEIEDFPWRHGKAQGFRHVGAVAQCVQGSTDARRSDLFWLLRPRVSSESKEHPLILHLERMLFGDDYEWHDPRCYQRWATLAARFFGTDPGPGLARGAYDLFWQATGKWLERAVMGVSPRFGHRRHSADQCAGALVQALRNTRARVVPLVTDARMWPKECVPQAFPVPDRREERDGGGRLQFRLFFRPPDEAREHPLDLPQAVLERGRAITSYTLDANLAGVSERILGTAEFSRWEFLADLRQLPATLGDWSPATSLEPKKHLDVLAFVAQLYATRSRRGDTPQDDPARYGWGWRGNVAHAELVGRAGRALATLFLRTTEGMYEPARQLSIDRVNREWLAPLSERIPTLNLDGFLYFLGVSPVAGLLLVEDGEKGVVITPCSEPPGLTDADGFSGRLELVVQTPAAQLADRLTRAWPILEPVLTAETKGHLKVGIREALSKQPFVSCEMPGLHTPQVLRGPKPSFISPDEIVLSRAQDRRRPVLFSLDVADGPLSRLLVALGAIEKLDEQHLQADQANAALRLLKSLRRLDLEAVSRHPAARTALLELFQNVLDAIARCAPLDTAPELLGYAPADEASSLTERELRWFALGEPACIAKDNADREWIRRIFHQQPLITATLGSDVIQRLPALEKRRATVSATVRVSGEEQAQDAHALKRTVEELLPGLLALAELSRQVTGGLKLDDVAERWRRLRIRRAENVWYHVELKSKAGLWQGGWLEDSRGNIVVEEEARGTPPTIWLDTPGDPSESVPLRALAEPLALTVVGNPVVAGTFALALAEYDGAGGTGDPAAARQRFEAFLQKQGAARIAHSYGRELKPLNDEQRTELLEAVRQALANLNLALQDVVASGLPRVLGLRNLDLKASQLGDSREDDVRRSLLGVPSPENLKQFVPDFVCRGENETRWKDWLSEERRRERLVLLTQRLKAGASASDAVGTDLTTAALHEAWERQLEEVAGRQFTRLGFSPVTVAYEWLAQVLERTPPFEEAELLQQLIVPNRYEPITTLVDAPDCTWRTRSLEPAPPSERELAPQTPEQRHAEDVKKAAIGADAEEAFLELVVHRTAEILTKLAEEGWGVLMRTTNERSVRHQHLCDARKPAIDIGLLRKALHVSKYDGAAGFDVLGLELDENGAPRAVCYECKALPDGRHARVFISRNELATMRRLRKEPAGGRWKLIGVHTSSKAQDLTHLLDVVHDESSGLLVELARHGLAFDSLILSISSSAP